VLAEMEAWNHRAAVSEAQSRYETAPAANEQSAGGERWDRRQECRRFQADYWKAEVEAEQADVGNVHSLRSPDRRGFVATPHRGKFRGAEVTGGRFVSRK